MGMLLLHILTSNVTSITVVSATTATGTTMLNDTLVTGNTTTAATQASDLNGNRTCHDNPMMCDCGSPQTTASGNATRGMLSDEGSLDALLYIVVVLLFYAFSIVVLMVKYIRRENKEAYLRQYFDEFVAREQFQSAKTRNQICLKNIMDKRNDLVNGGQLKTDLSSGTACEGENSLLCIPETINESAEDEGEVFECELDEDKLLEELAQTLDYDDMSENEQVTILDELLPRRETPV